MATKKKASKKAATSEKAATPKKAASPQKDSTPLLKKGIIKPVIPST